MKSFIILLLAFTLLSCTTRRSRVKQAELIVKADTVQPVTKTPNYYFVDSVTSIKYEYTLDSTDIKYTLCVNDKLMPKAFTYHSSFAIMASGEDAKKEILSYLTYLYNEKYLIPFEFN